MSDYYKKTKALLMDDLEVAQAEALQTPGMCEYKVRKWEVDFTVFVMYEPGDPTVGLNEDVEFLQAFVGNQDVESMLDAEMRRALQDAVWDEIYEERKHQECPRRKFGY